MLARRRFAVAPDRVFDAWLNRAALARWMFGPAVRDEEIEHLAIDPRVGGHFSVLVAQGADEIEHTGRYLEIERPRRLAFTWIVGDAPVGSRVLIDFAASDGGCELSLTQEVHPSWADEVPRIEREWATMLDALAMVVEPVQGPGAS